MFQVYSLRLAVVLSLALAGCGRLGFEPSDPDWSKSDGGAATGAEEDAGALPSDMMDDVDPSVDAGSPDGKGSGKDLSDAGSYEGDGEMPFEPLGGDASLPVAGDGGTGSTFSCADFTSALACTTFNDGAPTGWYVDERRPGQAPQFYDGIVDTRTNGDASDSYVSADFANLYGGTLYFRIRVMFPSDGDLTSVNFITVGNYDDESDYGVELDAVNGRLAFNSSSDGFRYTDFVLARDQWLCIDAQIVLDSTDGEMSARVDGVDALDVQNVDTVPRAGTSLVDIGIDWTRGDQGYAHVLVDEFVISRDPVACP